MKLTDEVKKVISEQKIGYVATAGPKGLNVSPKMIVTIDDETIAFCNIFSAKTRANLGADPRVAVAIADHASHNGFQLRGRATIHASGPVYEKLAQACVGMGLPKPADVITIKVEDVCSVKPGA